jgi:hypothetical protein
MDTPPRPWRAEAEVKPVKWAVESIGLMSSPFMTVISGLPMRAQLSPRDWATHWVPDATVVAPVAVLLKMHLFCSVDVPGMLLFRNGP